MAHCKPKRNSWISRSSKWFRYLSKISDTLINLPRLFQKNQRKHNSQSYDLTWLSTISSARISFMVHPPPMRNEIFLPTIRKQGKMRVPWGGSALSWYSRPAGSFSLGRFSVPLIHQSPCCWALSLLRAAGLSPNVGWWMKAVPVISHHRFHLQSQDCKLVRKKERRRNVYPAECSMTIIRYYKLHFTALCLPLLQYAPVNSEGHLQRNPLSVYPA